MCKKDYVIIFIVFVRNVSSKVLLQVFVIQAKRHKNVTLYKSSSMKIRIRFQEMPSISVLADGSLCSIDFCSNFAKHRTSLYTDQYLIAYIYSLGINVLFAQCPVYTILYTVV